MLVFLLTYLAYQISGLIGFCILYVVGNYLMDQSGKPLHVHVNSPKMQVGGFNILPLLSAVFNALPHFIRRKLHAKNSAPKPEAIRDWYDHFGEDPYTIEEVEKDKVWKVSYALEEFFGLSSEAKMFGKLLGMDFEDPETVERTKKGAENFSKEAAQQVMADLQRNKEIASLVEAKGCCAETVSALGKHILNMVVVRLNSGGLLLYCPVRVRDGVGELSQWLESMGPVEWIVAPSSAHSLMLPSVLARFPEAKFVAHSDTELKLQAISGIPRGRADFDYTSVAALQEANRQLSKEGVSLHYVSGDCMTGALIGVAHKRVAMECDIVYSHNDGGFFLLDREQADLFRPEDLGARLFKWNLATKPTSPNNALPPYRFWAMDPVSSWKGLAMTQAKSDGSSCTDMANSLRSILALEFDKAVGCHINQMDGEKFRQSVDINWNWLDGRSLLPHK